MGKILIIAEKDSLGAQIAKALGIKDKKSEGGCGFYENENVIVAMASGHLVQRIPAQNSTNLPFLPTSYKLEPIKQKFRKLALIKKLAHRQDVDEICNACDPGREGELIGYLIYAYTGCRKKYTRLWANTQTPIAIRQSFSERKPAEHYANQLNAALCRHDADFKVGINITRCLQTLMRKLHGEQQMHTAGRVRTPTMAKVYDLEQRILNFKPATYYELEATLQDIHGTQIKASWLHPDLGEAPDSEPEEDQDDQSDADVLAYKLTSRERAELYCNDCLETTHRVRTILEPVTVYEPPPGLFDITDLIEEANSRFKWPVKQVTDNLQVLYENGLVTYPRSESKFLGEDAVQLTAAKLAWLAVNGYPEAAAPVGCNAVTAEHYVFNTDKLIDGHGAIVPDVPAEDVSITQFTEDQQALYALIVSRFIKVFYPDAVYSVRRYLFSVGLHKFTASQKRCEDLGWRVLEDKQPEAGPVFEIGNVALAGVEVLEKQTRPPKRLTIGKLPKMMKRFHLGTAATRGPIVSELMAKSDKDKKRIQYLLVEKNTVYPSPANGQVIEFLRQHHIEDLTQHEMTAKLEQDLEAISNGKLTPAAFTEAVDREVTRMVDQFQQYLETVPEFRKLAGHCPQCGKELYDTGRNTLDCECGFKLWKKIWGVSLSEQALAALLAPPHQTETIKGFVSKAGKKFDAPLRLDPAEGWKVVPVFASKNTPQSGDMQETPYQCPICQSKLQLQVFADTNKQLVCPSGEHKFALRLFVAKRKLSGEEVQELLSNRYLSSRQGYIGKTGKPFATALRMADDGSLEFIFDNK
ncbi:DNA topoisomerase-3 [Neisseria sp. HSC-16F19]|nr:type IA DNA topoisomerase [Neisseria sp. HSC-16F19]MCP2041129.1 DNA topoisomerase-3 [Neisseria sp. HSC-16F19]